MSEPGVTAPPPSPGPLGAVSLTGLAWSVMVLLSVLATPTSGGVFGLALGTVLGFGGAATLAARGVPAPAERRIGLRGFPPRVLAPVLLLAPAVLLASELDNWIARLFGSDAATPDAASLDGLATLELVLFAALLRPVVEEFFFRGVVQQGVVAALGPVRGALLVALLFALVRASFGVGDAQRAASLGAQALCQGALLSGLRLASGSILPGILLQVADAAVGHAAYAGRERLAIPGFNAGGDHTPLGWLVPAAVSVALGVAWLVRIARSRAAGR